MKRDSQGREFVESGGLKVGQRYTIMPGEAVTIIAEGDVEIDVGGVTARLEKGQRVTYEAGRHPLTIRRYE